MNRRTTTAPIVVAILGMGVLSAHAGPCTKEIAKFERAVRQSANNPNAGAIPAPIDPSATRSPTDARFGQAGRGAGAGNV